MRCFPTKPLEIQGSVDHEVVFRSDGFLRTTAYRANSALACRASRKLLGGAEFIFDGVRNHLVNFAFAISLSLVYLREPLADSGAREKKRPFIGSSYHLALLSEYIDDLV